MSLAAFAKTALTLLAQILGIAQNLSTAQQLDDVQRMVSNVFVKVANLTYGLEAAYAQHVEMLNDLTSMTVTLNALAADYQQRAVAVTLPTTPPSGYGGGTGATASDVWGFHLVSSGRAAGDVLDDAGGVARNLSTAEVRFSKGQTKYFEFRGTWYSAAGPASSVDYPIFPIANILPADTLDVFLERESGFNGWTPNGDGTWQVFEDPAHTDFIIFSTITDAEFLVLRDGPAAAGALVAAPVWPGLANVTLGTPVSLDLGVTITEPMDGIIISITGAPTKQGYFTFDDLLSYRNIGAITFIDDNGDAEFWQGLGFTSAVYCPTTMRQAASVKVRTSVDVIGTVTPWTITPV